MKVALLSITLALGVAILPASAQAFSEHYQLDIPSQTLDATLKELSRRSGLQIAHLGDTVKGDAIVGPIHGDLSIEQALKQLLTPQGLTFKAIDDHTIAVVNVKDLAGFSTQQQTPLSSPAAAKGREEGESPSSNSFRVAEMAQGATAQAATVTANGAAAQGTAASPPLEEIVVTAQKRVERLIDVPISIGVVTDAELQARNIFGLTDLAFAVPGVGIEQSGDERRIFMRGVSNYGGGNSALIGMYLDEAGVTSNPLNQLDLRTYDLERVEVLRGPQGTLYGEGSAGGTIRFITRDPQLNQFSFSTTGTVAFTQSGAPSQRIEEVLNLPLVDDTLALRIAGEFDHEGGWIDQPAADRTNINAQDLTDVRIKALWKPMTELTVKAMGVIHRNNAGLGVGDDRDGNYTQVFNLTTTPRAKDNYSLGNLTLTYDFTGARLLSTASYIDQYKLMADYGAVEPETPPGTPADDFYNTGLLSKNKIASEELRLSSAGSGAWQWTLGGFYRHAQFDTDYEAIYFDVPGPPGSALPTPSPFDSSNLYQSWSAFADTCYRLADRLTLGLGVRYFDENQEYISGGSQSTHFHSTDPRVYLQYKLSNDANLYASAAKGFRSGGFNPDPSEAPYGPESVWTYELGTKMAPFQGQLTLNADVFYSNYTNYQTTGIPPPPALDVDITSNAGSARIDGVEWDITWRPVNEWTLSFSGDYVHSYFYKINSIPIEIGIPSSPYTVGDPLDFFPKYQFTVSAQHNFSWNEKSGFVRLDYDAQGRSTYRNRSIGPWYFSESDLINLLNLNTNLQWSDSLSLGLFVQNLLNDRGYLDADAVEASAARPQPRTFGIRFNVAFH